MLAAIKWVAIVGVIVILAGSAHLWAGGNGNAAPNANNSYLSTEFDYHTIEPLGVETLKLEPAEKLVNLMVSAASPELEGIRRVPHGAAPMLVAADGKPVLNFPSELVFRITASAGGDQLDPDSLPTETKLAPEDYILHLRFRLKVFHDLDSWIVEPQSQEMIGMPAEIQYSERIYLVRFHVPNLPATDRITLEVLDEDGKRVTHFHLELL
jgi:hypothetical protein